MLTVPHSLLDTRPKAISTRTLQGSASPRAVSYQPEGDECTR